MRIKLMTLCMALCSLCFNAFAQNVPDSVPTDGLVAWYSFNGSGVDEGLLENHLQILGATSSTDRFMNESGALYFNGGATLEESSFNGIGENSSHTISFWETHSSIDNLCILSENGGNYYTGDKLHYCLRGPDDGVCLDGGCIGLDFYNSQHFTSFTAELDNWNHWVLTYESMSQNSQIFLNGILVSAQPMPTSWTGTFDDGICIGAFSQSDEDASHFIGSIDDFGIWDRPLSPLEIEGLYGLTASGCLDPGACNYFAEAEFDDGNCDYSCCPGPGCCLEGTTWHADLGGCIPTDSFCPEDLDFDGIIGINDLMQLLSSFGTMCEEPETVEFSCGDPMNYHGYDYATVQIGEQCWFAENCRHLAAVSPPSLGFEDDSLAHAYVQGYDGASVDEAMTMENYALHGVLYNQLAAESWDICPTGWHVPFDANISQQGDFEELKLALPANAIGTALKASPTDVPPWDGNNSSGFKGISSGARSLYWDGEFSWLDITAFYWSQSGWSRRLDSNDENLSLMGLGPAWGLSVRCLKDTE